MKISVTPETAAELGGTTDNARPIASLYSFAVPA